MGKTPQTAAFDGTNMWVTNAADGTVTKLSLPGATLGTFPAAAPVSIAFDGVNMWTASSTTVTKLSPAGATLGTYPAGAGAYGNIAFDGIHMWVSSYNAAVVTEL